MPLDYRPDLPEDTPGLLTFVVDMFPTSRGYKVAQAPQQQTSHELTLSGSYANESPFSSLYATRWLASPGGIVVAGTNKDLYVYDYANGFGSIGKAGGYSLTGSTYQYGEDAVAAFDQCSFGDVLIAAHKSIVPQYRTATTLNTATKYADLGTTVTAPKASVCASVSNFLFLGDLHSTWGSTATVVGAADMVAWCGLGDHQNWDVTPTSSQGSYAQFTDTPGPITALAPLADGLVVFKANAMYLGRYVGAGPNSPIWDFVRISDRIGCIGPRSVVDVGNQLVFTGTDDAYIFDGTRPRSITEGIWETEFKNLTNYGGIWPMWLGHDKPRNCVLFRRSNNPGYTLVWSYRFNKWSVLQDTGTGSALNGLDNYTDRQNIFCKTNVSDFRVVTSTAVGSGTINTDHYDLHSMFATTNAQSGGAPTKAKCYNRFNANTNYSGSAQLITGAIGSDDAIRRITRISPKWAAVPTSATCRVNYKASLGEAYTIGASSISMDARYRFDVLLGAATQNWQAFTITLTGQNAAEIIDIGYTPKPAGYK